MTATGPSDATPSGPSAPPSGPSAPPSGPSAPPSATPRADGATQRALAYLERAGYLLDRGLAAPAKVRAFHRAAEVVGALDDDELLRRATGGSLTDLAGIGPSTGSVVTDAVFDRPSDYLEDLDRSTACAATVGAELRAALRGDLHLHTTWSDGGAPVRKMAEAAMALGHDYIAVTDHSPRLTVAHGLSVERLAEQVAEIRWLNEELAPFRILTGMEVDILVDGTLDLPDESLAELDVVVASVHSKLRMERTEMTRRMVRAIANPHVDVLGHCTGRKVTGTGRPPSDFDAEIVFAACAQMGVAVEVNCRPERRDPPEELLELAQEWGCTFSVDTDAHAPGQLEWQPWGCDLLASHGVDAGSVLNTLPADELLARR